MDRLIELARLNRIHDPFYAEKDSKELFEWLSGEIDEGKEELGKGDFAELENEMGDIFWNILALMDKLEDEGKINKEQVFTKIVDKISRRKTFLLEKRTVTEDEAKAIWNQAKRNEGYEESRLRWDK